ncbi:MAG: hypothetical protein FD123_3088 [Bacteroidetes bacterium]|nr:MAG: hypothetical protein FD123_3088 [Bacteroidota bacterium]
MDGEGISSAVIISILLLVHVFICGVISLLALLFGELLTKRKMRYLPMLLGPFVTGVISFFICFGILQDDDWFYPLYGTLSVAGLFAGFIYSARKSKEKLDETAG